MNKVIPLGGSVDPVTVGNDPTLPPADVLYRSPLTWLRQLRVDREYRKIERENRRTGAAHQRLADRLADLAGGWRVLDLKSITGDDRGSLLAVGPGGVFAVTVKDHGRSRINFAGDVVQVEGRRLKYVAEARENAKFATEALSRRAGVSVPVMPVLAFAGSGMISFHGLPKGCVVASYQDLHRVLQARGRRLALTTVEKVYAVANQDETWVNESYAALADRYRWYSDVEREAS